MRKTLGIIGLLGMMGLFAACGADAGLSQKGAGVPRLSDEQMMDAVGMALTAGQENGGADARSQLPAKFIAYLKGLEDGSVSVDVAEWVSVPGSRAEELGISEEDEPNGFSMYNPDTAVERLPLSADCKITVLDWENNNAVKEVSADEFSALLKARGAQGIGTPYWFEQRDGEVFSIVEQYIP